MIVAREMGAQKKQINIINWFKLPAVKILSYERVIRNVSSLCYVNYVCNNNFQYIKQQPQLIKLVQYNFQF